MKFIKTSTVRKCINSIVSITGKAALIGLRALNRLMSGAREVSRPDINPREYVKKGGIFSAVDDFYAAFPDNIRVFQEQNKVI